MGKITKTLAILVFLGVAAAATPACASSAGASHRHRSGLLIVTDEEIRERNPDGLRDTLGAYDMLSHAYPDDLGYANVINGEVTIDVATDEGAAIVESFMAGEAVRPDPKEDHGGKMAQSVAEQQKKIVNVQIARRRVEYTRTATDNLQEEIINLASEFRSAGIHSDNVHRPTGQIVLRMEKLTDDLAAAIVDRYGTEKVVVVLEPARIMADELVKRSTMRT